MVARSAAGDSGFGLGRRPCRGGERIGRTVRAGHGMTRRASLLGRDLQRRIALARQQEQGTDRREETYYGGFRVPPDDVALSV